MLVGISIGLVIGLALGVLVTAIFDLHNMLFPDVDLIQQSKIFCNADESVQSSWTRTYPENRSKFYYVVSGMNETELPELRIKVTIRNNNSISLFNTGIEVTYKTIDNKSNTITKTNLGFVDANSVKDIEIIITNPYVSLWETKKAVYNDPDTHWTNGTVCLLDLDDINTIAYGYAEP